MIDGLQGGKPLDFNLKVEIRKDLFDYREQGRSL